MRCREARNRHQQNRVSFERGERPGAAPVTLNVSRLFEQYWAKAPHKGTRSLPERQRLINRDVIRAIGKEDATTITRARLMAIFEDIADRGAGTVANRVREILRACRRWAYRRDMVPTNVADDLPDMKREIQREVVVGIDKLAALWSRLNR